MKKTNWKKWDKEIERDASVLGPVEFIRRLGGEEAVKRLRKPGGGRKAKTAGAKRVSLSTCMDSRARAELDRRVTESGLSLPDWLSREYMPQV